MESTTIKNQNISGLKQKWDELKLTQPRLRAKDAADKLGVTEAELVASSCDGEAVVRLKDDWEGIFNRLESLGKVMALTRNEAAVHEKTGFYQNVSFNGHVGLVLDERIDLRVFHKRWGSGFAVPVENAKGTLHSIQFFDKAGQAVHKIYLKDDSKLEKYQELVNDFRADDQSAYVVIKKRNTKENLPGRLEIETEALLEAWTNLKDTHDFYPMLRKFKVGRTHALQLAKQKYTWQIDNSAIKKMLELASEQAIPIMVFVSNNGMIQIHSGPVHKIHVMDNWLNILDPDFNLHLRQDLIDSTWIVNKPTNDGIVTSLEIFNSDGESIATFFGARKPGKPELESWREIIIELKKLEVAG